MSFALFIATLGEGSSLREWADMNLSLSLSPQNSTNQVVFHQTCLLSVPQAFPSKTPFSARSSQGETDMLSLQIPHELLPFCVIIMMKCALCCAVLCLVTQPYLTPCDPSLLCPWGFSRQEYWSGLPCPPPGDLPNPGIEPRSPTLQADSLPSEPPGEPKMYPTIQICWDWGEI